MLLVIIINYTLSYWQQSIKKTTLIFLFLTGKIKFS